MTETATLNSTLRDRYKSRSGIVVGVTDSNSGLTCEIAGIFFFKTEAEANNCDVVTMSFAGANATGSALTSSAKNGTWVLDGSAIQLTRNSSDTLSAYATAGYGYRAFLQFNDTGKVWNGVSGSVGDLRTAERPWQSVKDGYVRVAYKLTLPSGTDSVDFAILQDNDLTKAVEWTDLTNTDGFVLTDTASFPVDHAHIGRFMRCEKEAFALETTVEGVEFEILGVYFFETQAAADAFSLN